MTTDSTDPRESLAPGDREDRAAAGSGSAATVAQPTEVPRGPQSEDVVADWWARAETAWATSDFPQYGSPEWEALDDTDPSKLAAMLSAAEKWRQL
ncbi:DUF2742 domain-containing protein [Streptomyces sp. NPDC086077]|uniref:DUF2742 domain-containing protein n=1 Tax=Streptomyces sp. NPDC086077 TaxID=3154862 RepID=UPI00342F412B